MVFLPISVRFIYAVILFFLSKSAAAELRVKSTHVSMIESEVNSPISAVTTTLQGYHLKQKHKCIHHGSHFDQDFIKRQINQIMFYNMTLVNESRLNATLLLAKAAMHLPGGDFVETGLFL